MFYLLTMALGLVIGVFVTDNKVFRATVRILTLPPPLVPGDRYLLPSGERVVVLDVSGSMTVYTYCGRENETPGTRHTRVEALTGTSTAHFALPHRLARRMLRPEHVVFAHAQIGPTLSRAQIEDRATSNLFAGIGK